MSGQQPTEFLARRSVSWTDEFDAIVMVLPISLPPCIHTHHFIGLFIAIDWATFQSGSFKGWQALRKCKIHQLYLAHFFRRYFNGNELTALPEGLFQGLTSLTHMQDPTNSVLLTYSLLQLPQWQPIEQSSQESIPRIERFEDCVRNISPSLTHTVCR